VTIDFTRFGTRERCFECRAKGIGGVGRRSAHGSGQRFYRPGDRSVGVHSQVPVSKTVPGLPIRTAAESRRRTRWRASSNGASRTCCQGPVPPGGISVHTETPQSTLPDPSDGAPYGSRRSTSSTVGACPGNRRGRRFLEPREAGQGRLPCQQGVGRGPGDHPPEASLAHDVFRAD